MPTELLIIGAGGHAKVVIDAVVKGQPDCRIIMTDQDPARAGEKLWGKYLINPLDNWPELPEYFHVALGDNRSRQRLAEMALEEGKQAFTVVHSDSSVSPASFADRGCFIAARAVIGPDALINEGCIINHGAVVDHDCRVGAFTHIAPNTTLGGGVIIGTGCMIGAGAIILPGVKIGDDVVIGAGAVVTKDVPDKFTIAGVPGRCVSK